jgi:hypothetical protein
MVTDTERMVAARGRGEEQRVVLKAQLQFHGGEGFSFG